MAMENKHKHMDYIQSTISRMASNSFYLKGWSVTIVAALAALSIKEGDWRMYGCALFLTFVFWILDAYCLRQEKLFRSLYAKVSQIKDDKSIDYSMDTSEFEKDVPSVLLLMVFNISVTPLYASISVILVILIRVTFCMAQVRTT